MSRASAGSTRPWRGLLACPTPLRTGASSPSSTASAAAALSMTQTPRQTPTPDSEMSSELSLSHQARLFMLSFAVLALGTWGGGWGQGYSAGVTEYPDLVLVERVYPKTSYDLVTPFGNECFAPACHPFRPRSTCTCRSTPRARSTPRLARKELLPPACAHKKRPSGRRV